MHGLWPHYKQTMVYSTTKLREVSLWGHTAMAEITHTLYFDTTLLIVGKIWRDSIRFCKFGQSMHYACLQLSLAYKAKFWQIWTKSAISHFASLILQGIWVQFPWMNTNNSLMHSCTHTTWQTQTRWPGCISFLFGMNLIINRRFNVYSSLLGENACVNVCAYE